MSIFFDSWAIEVYNGSWVDIINDVRQNPRPVWNRGIMSRRPDDRVGHPGYFNFTLDNSTHNMAGIAGYYSPGHVNCWDGWKSGLPVRLYFVADGVTYYKYYGRIKPDGIQVSPFPLGQRDVLVSCGDFMWRALQHELSTLTFALNQKIGDVVTAVNSNMPIPPLATSIATGVETFPSIFDMTYLRTTAANEYLKAAMSEWAYIYVKGDKTGGETLVVENQETRAQDSVADIATIIGTQYNLLKEDTGILLLETGDKIQTDLVYNVNISSLLPIFSSEDGKLLKEDGDYLLKEDGDNILIGQTQYALFDNMAVRGAGISYGDLQANRINSYVYPRRFDSAATATLWSLQTPFMVEAGTTIAGYRCAYRDPANENIQISNMAGTASSLNYTASTDQAGTAGTAIVSSLLITADYGTGEALVTLQNTAVGTPIWVQTLNVVGQGAFTYENIQSVRNNTSSQAIHGVIPLSLDFKYLSDARKAQSFSEYILLREAWPRTTIDSYPVWANEDSMRLFGFLALEPGTRATFIEDQSGINKPFFINGYSAEIYDGKYVLWSPVLCDDPGYYSNVNT